VIVTKRELATEVFGVSEETITQWQKAGMPVKTQRKGTLGNEYVVVDCVQWREMQVTDGEGPLNLNQERARLAKAQADKTELEASELKGEMVRYEELSAHWTARGSALKARLLTMPTKISPRMRVAVNDQEGAALMTAEILEALAEISGTGIPLSVTARRQRSERLAQTTADSDGERVGGRGEATVERKRGRTGSVED
jgi:phage terminase Nu1 subunit (DNA packaging protein)